jgi:hypothetical protein
MLQGQGWPALSFVNIALTQAVAVGVPSAPQFIAQGVAVDGTGQFMYTFSIPVNQGWESVPQINIQVMTLDQMSSAVTPFYVTAGVPGEYTPPGGPGIPGQPSSPWRPFETPAWGAPAPGQEFPVRPMG